MTLWINFNLKNLGARHKLQGFCFIDIIEVLVLWQPEASSFFKIHNNATIEQHLKYESSARLFFIGWVYGCMWFVLIICNSLCYSGIRSRSGVNCSTLSWWRRGFSTSTKVRFILINPVQILLHKNWLISVNIWKYMFKLAIAHHWNLKHWALHDSAWWTLLSFEAIEPGSTHIFVILRSRYCYAPIFAFPALIQIWTDSARIYWLSYELKKYWARCSWAYYPLKTNRPSVFQIFFSKYQLSRKVMKEKLFLSTRPNRILLLWIV